MCTSRSSAKSAFLVSDWSGHNAIGLLFTTMALNGYGFPSRIAFVQPTGLVLNFGFLISASLSSEFGDRLAEMLTC